MGFHRTLTAVRANETVIGSIFAHRTRKTNANHRQNAESDPYRATYEHHARDESHTGRRNQHDGGNSQAPELLEIGFHCHQLPVYHTDIIANERLKLALRDLVEVRGVEPLSETESTKRLRVYPAFDLGNGKRTSALSRNHPFGSAPCSGRAELPAAWPAKLCLGAQQTSALRHAACYLGGKSVISFRSYFFPSFFTWPTRIHDARSDLNVSRRNRITPSRLSGVLYQKKPRSCALSD